MFQGISNFFSSILQTAVKFNMASPVISKTTMCREIVSQYLPSVNCTEVSKEIIGYEPTIQCLAIGAIAGIGLYALKRTYDAYFDNNDVSLPVTPKMPPKAKSILPLHYDKTALKSRTIAGLDLEGQIFRLKKPKSESFSKTLDGLALDGLNSTTKRTRVIAL